MTSPLSLVISIFAILAPPYFIMLIYIILTSLSFFFEYALVKLLTNLIIANLILYIFKLSENSENFLKTKILQFFEAGIGL